MEKVFLAKRMGILASQSSIAPDVKIGFKADHRQVRDRKLKRSFVRRVQATGHIGHARGGSQPHFLRCSDQNVYVVKVLNNPQRRRVLANELLAHQIATFMSLPIPPCAIVNISEEFVNSSPEFRIETFPEDLLCATGPAFGSRCRADAQDRKFVRDVVVANVRDLAGMLVFDKWTGNTDTRQLLYVGKREPFVVEMIDNGFCFGSDWKFVENRPAVGLFTPLYQYFGPTDMDSFEPWLRIVEEDLSLAVLQGFAAIVPKEWYSADHTGLDALLSELNQRRQRVREQVRNSLAYLASKRNCC